jgi:hypothetical protein
MKQDQPTNLNLESAVSNDSFFFKRTYRRAFPPGSVGEAARDTGMNLVMQNSPEFSYQFFHTILRMPPGTIFLCEDIKAGWKGAWAKPQAWGANVNACIRYGLLEHMPQETNMRLPRSHARKTHWLRRTGKTMDFPRRKKKPKGDS